MLSVIFIIISVIIQSLNAATPTEFVKLIEYVRFAQNAGKNATYKYVNLQSKLANYTIHSDHIPDTKKILNYLNPTAIIIKIEFFWEVGIKYYRSIS